MTWRDLAWLLVSATVGFALSLLAVLLLLLVVTGALWWFGIGPIMTARSALDRWLLTYGHTEVLEQRVQTLTETRADTIDHSATELRRIERDLHDGAQARLVALGMSLGMAEEMWARDPEARAADPARGPRHDRSGPRRPAVRGPRHPPTRARRPRPGRRGRGAGAGHGDPGDGVRRADGAAAGPGRVGRLLRRRGVPGQRRQARRRPQRLGRDHPRPVAGLLQVLVGDDGQGGADPAAGTGMRGVMRRLAAFDGTMRVSSPPGGPTLVTLEVPCALSSPRTMPSSGTA